MDPTRTIALPGDLTERREVLPSREWLVTNGNGGYASGTLGGVPTRKHHGALIASLANPRGRTVMLTKLREILELPDGLEHQLTGEARTDAEIHLPGVELLTDFHLEMGLPVWRFKVGAFVLERRVLMPHLQNTTHLSYRLVSGEGSVQLKLRPALNFRSHEEPVSTELRDPHVLTSTEGRLEITGDPSRPPLRLNGLGGSSVFVIETEELTERLYRVEQSRGYTAVGQLWSPGRFEMDLTEGDEVTLVASTEPWETILALSPVAAREAEMERRRKLLSSAPEGARSGVAAELVLAADAFVVSPAYRADHVARVRAAGNEMRTVIAGYHWFSDWGRDTMIALEGLTLCTGRQSDARCILRTFAEYTRDGLIPNLFPEERGEGLYHTADASLWFFHAVDRYLQASGDRDTIRELVPTLRSIVDCHLAGTRFGIRIDSDDGLLTQGEEGYQLTWMDAKVDDWVVTPRRGKAVELNALWYNALRLLATWLRDEGDETEALRLDERAEQTGESFNRRFWNNDDGYLHDVIDTPDGSVDSAFRPNQLFAFSLRHPVLDRSRWAPVLQAVQDKLLTPYGLRSLAPGHPDYRRDYHGDLRTRDGAYHQGTVWAWLIGPFVDAYLRVNPDDPGGAERFLNGLIEHLDDFGIGSVAEIFDAEPPFTARGCIAQAWSVSELLRCILLVGGEKPAE
ncbi:amylo-alpha-1,6-glucosidase [soil metagenome]